MKRLSLSVAAALFALSLPALALTPPLPKGGQGESEQPATLIPSEPARADNPLELAQATATQKKSKQPDVVYVPTPQKVVDRMLELADVKKGNVVYDLGCGDGRIVVTAAKKYGVKATGYDIDPERIKEANENVQKAGVEDLVSIKQEDIFTLDLSQADVVTLYLLPRLNVRLIPQLEKLKPGSRIVSHAFDMQGVTPDKRETVTLDDGSEHTVYLWTTPLKKENSPKAKPRKKAN